MSSGKTPVTSSAIKTTLPGTENTVGPERQVPSLALVVLWSAAQPHRVGEVAFLPPFETRILGREGGDDFVLFGTHRPGEPFEPNARDGLLAGNRTSRRQLVLRSTAVGVEVEQVGRCVTLVNGKEVTRARLQPGFTLMLRKEALFFCTMRTKTHPGPRAVHAYGGPDAFDIVGEGPAAYRLREELARAAATDDNVLVLGEEPRKP